MPITELQRQERRKWNNASDMAAILGLSKYATAYDVWAWRMGMVEDSKENEAMRLGTSLEPVILQEAEHELGPLLLNVEKGKPDFYLHANLDAVVIATGNPVEIKTSGIVGPLHGAWGEDWTSDIPEYYLVQVYVQMICADATAAHVRTLLGGRGYAKFEIELNPEIADGIIAASVDFEENYIRKGTPPPASLPSEDLVKRIRRVPKKVVQVGPNLIESWRWAKDVLKEKESELAMARAAIMKVMGDAEAVDGGDAGMVTYLEQNSPRAIDRDRMKADGIFEKYAEPQKQHRVLRHKEAKG